jgi:hypothetical protein
MAPRKTKSDADSAPALEAMTPSWMVETRHSIPKLDRRELGSRTAVEDKNADNGKVKTGSEVQGQMQMLSFGILHP